MTYRTGWMWSLFITSSDGSIGHQTPSLTMPRVLSFSGLKNYLFNYRLYLHRIHDDRELRRQPSNRLRTFWNLAHWDGLWIFRCFLLRLAAKWERWLLLSLVNWRERREREMNECCGLLGWTLSDFYCFFSFFFSFFRSGSCWENDVWFSYCFCFVVVQSCLFVCFKSFKTAAADVCVG